MTTGTPRACPPRRPPGQASPAALEDQKADAPALDSPAGSLWLFFVFAQAHRQVITGQVDAADLAYREVLALEEALPVSKSQQHRLAVTYTSSAGSSRPGDGWMRPMTGIPGLRSSWSKTGSGQGWR